ncbi:hypothetical protein M569_07547 [Genlisea aurea]|uniref:TF-B3 domain-containing protein n=1 Tax=Genlisea aurea TaxID=192259 RepID=S8CKJ6_9LAMI|nr:hypothetical protein M569_07547 [Genlisea aurea]
MAEGFASNPTRRETFRLTKTLTRQDALPRNSELGISPDEAYRLTGDSVFRVEIAPRQECITVYDASGYEYHMCVTNLDSSLVRVRNLRVGGSWGTFVYRNKLKAGDEVTFYETDERDKAGNHRVFVVRHVKR